MELYLLRHAAAEARAPGRKDAARRLTREGRKELAEVVKGLKKLGVRFDRVCHSPMLRAVESAELLSPILDGESEVTPGLADEPDASLLRAIAGKRVALVGHEPWLSELVSWLLLGTPGHADRFPLKKAGVAVLAGEPKPGGMALLALYEPRALRGAR